MLAARLIAPYQLVLNEEPTAEIKADEALLQIQAVGICGSDMHRYHGVESEGLIPERHIILGHEFSAVVDKVGPAVKNVKEGDRVAVEAGWSCGFCEWCLQGHPNLCECMLFCGTQGMDGAFCEYKSWPARLLFKLNPTLSFDDGALAEPASICLHSISLAHMRPGQTAAVLGCGPIGLAAVHLLRKTTGTTLIIATDVLQYRADFSKIMGADVALNQNHVDIVSEVMRITKGRGVDVVFEAAGVDDTSRQAVEICANGGKIIIIGIPENDLTPFSTNPARRKGLSFRFIRRSKNTYPQVLSLMEKGTIDLKPLVTHHFPLSKIKEAMETVDKRKNGVIKTIINP